MRIVALLVALIAFWFAYDSATIVTPRDFLDDETYRDRDRVTREVIALTVPGARPFDWRSGGHAATADFHGEMAMSGPKINYVYRLLRRFDWSGVAFPDDDDGGPLATLIAQADLHRMLLEASGFDLVNSRAWAGDDRFDGMPSRVSLPNEVTRPNIHVSHDSRSGGTGHVGSGHGGYMLDLDAPSIVHHRVYMHRTSGAVIFTRMEYDQTRRDLLVELSYADRTIRGADYGDTRYQFTERIDETED